ncbi:MAG: peptidase S8 [Flavobacteriaceae bacterium]|nr:MAG: peptidase S8 [Flavobacteriaceae bacterium]
MDYKSIMGNKSILCFSLLVFGFNCTHVFGQSEMQKEKIKTNYSQAKIKVFNSELEKQYANSKKRVLRLAKSNGWVLSETLPNGTFIELQDIGSDNTPLYYTTLNDNVSHIARADGLYSGGILDLGLNGNGMQVGVWDSGMALRTHQEFDNRVTVADGTDKLDKHATMVMGTLVASGVKKKAKGVAFGATALTSDWTRDKIEVSEAAANGLLLSNHSYGIKTDRVPDWYFGSYIKVSQDWDKIMYNSPYYLMVTASGNAQNSRDNDAPIHGVNADGYDLILGFSASKNVLTVAAAETTIDNKGNLTKAKVAAYSSFGPMDDGRIKPDISGGGTNVFTTSSSGVKNYEISSGTSMATPGVTGSMLLLQQYYERLNNTFMKASTLKGLVLHTADDVQEAGPDYKMGWGVINAIAAAKTIANKEYTSIISEEELVNRGTYSINVNSNGKEALMVSISWTDPATGFVNRGILNDITAALVNDLDVRVTKNGETHYPWKLNAANASSAATKGDNKVDPFEKIVIENASGAYTITVSHKGDLSTGAQNYSLIVSGVAVTQCNVDVPSEITIEKADESTLTLEWQEAPDTLFEVQYKNENIEEWTTAYIYDHFITISEFIIGETYEFRVKAICTENITSEYTPKLSFSFEGKDTKLQDFVNYEALSTNTEISVIVYPNPAVEEISLEGNISSKAVYSIITTAGITVKKGNVAAADKIRVDDMSQGLYVLTIEDLSGVASTMFYKD